VRAIVGQRTVRDDELKYGLSVTGLIDPRRVVTNAGARPGDRLVLTKPIGTGAIVTALRRGIAPEDLVTRAVGWMTTLNRIACETMLEFEVHACTDITGFGLIGHASEVAKASGVTLTIEAGKVPVFNGVLDITSANRSGGLGSNQDHFAGQVAVQPGVAANRETILYDPQTSGGLLVAVREDAADRVEQALAAAGVRAVRIGVATARQEGTLIVVSP